MADDDDVRSIHGRPWPRQSWPDSDDGWREVIDDEIGQRLFDGDTEWAARLDADWYEDVEHAFDIEHPHYRERNAS